MASVKQNNELTHEWFSCGTVSTGLNNRQKQTNDFARFFPLEEAILEATKRSKEN
jgi:hypothetical protein